MATHHDAEILLKLYELRREERLRRARAFLIEEFSVANLEEHMKKYPRNSEQGALFRQVTTYWEMAASVVNNGALNEQLFFENNSEHFVVWEKIKHLVPEMRASRKNPLLFKNLETVAGRYEKWLSAQAPEAADVVRKTFIAAR